MTGDQDATVADLSQHDQVLHGIGRVAQAQVLLELELRTLYEMAAGLGPASFLASKRRGIDQVAQDCRVMLAHTELPDEWTAAGDEALRAAIEADKLRHKVVHEWWVQRPEAADPSLSRFRRLRFGETSYAYREEPSDLDFVDETERQLMRASLRCSGLTHALALGTMYGQWPPDEPIESPNPDELLAQVRGDFRHLPAWQHLVPRDDA